MSKDKQAGAAAQEQDEQRKRNAEAMETRTKAVVAALREALDKVYNEDGEQRVRRLASDYEDWAAETVPGHTGSLRSGAK